MDCNMIKELILTDYIDSRLTPQALKELEAHLALCGRCRSMASELKALNASFAGLRHKEPPFEVWERIRAKVSGNRPANVMENVLDSARLLFARLRPAVVVATAAALILVILAVARLMPHRDALTQEDMISFVSLDANGEYGEYGFGTPEEDYFL